MIANADQDWEKLLPEIDRMSVVEAELWFWRYATELAHAAGSGRDRYQRAIYEELGKHTLVVAKSIYAACELEWTAAIEQALMNDAEDSIEIAEAWKSRLTQQELQLVERVLDGSVLNQWWTD